MSVGEMAFLGLVLCAFATFTGVLGFISIWSRTPASLLPGADKPAVATALVTPELRKAA